MPIDKNNKKTDLLRPDVGPGKSELDLSLPQHAPSRDVNAVQKHHDTLVTATAAIVAFELQINRT